MNVNQPMDEQRQWHPRDGAYLYYNDEKLDYLLTEIFGAVETEFKKSETLGAKAHMKLAAKFGALLAWLGIGEISGGVGTDVSESFTKATVSKTDVFSKLRALISYYRENEEFPHIDVYYARSVHVDRDGGELSSGPLAKNYDLLGVGRIGGYFQIRRLNPTPDNDTSILRDLLDEKPNLWICESVINSEIDATIPFLTSNFRHTSQSAMMYFIRPTDAEIKIDCIGIMNWENDKTLTCDPIAWSVIG